MIPEIEKGTVAEIKTLQESKLKELINYVAENSPYYRRVLETIKSVLQTSIH